MGQRIVIGLTGPIGCGKSSVMRTLVSLGAEGIDADQVSHDVMARQGSAYAAVIARFGHQILAEDGEIDRARLAGLVFAAPAELAVLESTVHPAVAAEIENRLQESRSPVVIIEAIKLLEAGYSRQLCDQVWVVACQPEQQLARLSASRGMGAAEAGRRISNQMPLDQMAAQADRIIDAGGTLASEDAQLLGAWAELGLPFPTARIHAASLADAAGLAVVVNEMIAEGGQTELDRLETPESEAEFLSSLPPRAQVMVAELGNVVAGFQVVEPYATHAGAMDHVAALSSYVLPAARGHDIGQSLSEVTLAYARNAGFEKTIARARADDTATSAFYRSLGFVPCGRLQRQVRVGKEYVDELLFEMFL